MDHGQLSHTMAASNSAWPMAVGTGREPSPQKAPTCMAGAPSNSENPIGLAIASHPQLHPAPKQSPHMRRKHIIEYLGILLYARVLVAVKFFTSSF